jgi:hypothetical protein
VLRLKGQGSGCKHPSQLEWKGECRTSPLSRLVLYALTINNSSETIFKVPCRDAETAGELVAVVHLDKGQSVREIKRD